MTSPSSGTYRKDFETDADYRRRLAAEGVGDAEAPPTEAKPEPPSPFIVDAGIYTSRRDRDLIQREEDRITRLERMGR
jgi:hypothetical protein